METLPGKLDLKIYVGATFSVTLTWETGSTPAAVDLTGYTAAMDIRSGEGGTLLLTLSTSNSRITLGGAAGTIALTITAADTAALTEGLYEYDLLLTSGGGVVTPLVAGTVTVVAGVTQ